MAEHRRMSDREVAMSGTTTTAAAAPAPAAATEARPTTGRLGHEDQVIPDVRASDIEPYTGLRYLSKLFKVMGIVIGLLLIAEVATGLSQVGSAAIPTLLGEASRLLVLAGLLWGVGDLALLLIDVGHDVRAGRVLLSRQTYHMIQRGKIDSKSVAGGDAPRVSASDRTGLPEVR